MSQKFNSSPKAGRLESQEELMFQIGSKRQGIKMMFQFKGTQVAGISHNLGYACGGWGARVCCFVLIKPSTDCMGPTHIMESILLHSFCYAVLCSHVRIFCDHMDSSPPGSSVHGDSPGKNTGVSYHALLQGNPPNPGVKPGSPALQVDSFQSQPQRVKNTELNCYFLFRGIFPTQGSTHISRVSCVTGDSLLLNHWGSPYFYYI